MMKSTKVLLGMLAGTLVLVAAILIWAIFAGKLSSLADLTAGPGERLLTKKTKAEDFIRDDLNNVFVDKDGLKIVRHDENLQSLSEPKELDFSWGQGIEGIFQTASVISVGNNVYLFGAKPYTYKDFLDVYANRVFYFKLNDEGKIEGETKFADGYRYVALPLVRRSGNALCAMGGVYPFSVGKEDRLASAIYCAEVKEDGTLSHWKGLGLTFVTLSDAAEKETPPFFPVYGFTNSASDIYVSQNYALVQYVLNPNLEVRLKKIIHSPEGDAAVGKGEKDCIPTEVPSSTASGAYETKDICADFCASKVSADSFYRVFDTPSSAEVADNSGLSRKFILKNGDLSDWEVIRQTKVVPRDNFNQDSLNADFLSRIGLLEEKINSKLPSGYHILSTASTVVNTGDNRYLFFIAHNKDGEKSKFYLAKINDAENSDHYERAGVLSGIFVLDKSTKINKFIWKEKGDLSISGILGKVLAQNGNTDTNGNTNSSSAPISSLKNVAVRTTINIFGQRNDIITWDVPEDNSGVIYIFEKKNGEEHLRRPGDGDNYRLSLGKAEIIGQEIALGKDNLGTKTYVIKNAFDGDVLAEITTSGKVEIKNSPQFSNGNKPVLRMRLRTAGNDGVWSDFTDYKVADSVGSIDIGKSVKYVEYQAYFLSDANGNSSPVLEGVGLTTTGEGEVISPRNPLPAFGGIVSAGTLPRTGTPIDIWTLITVLLVAVIVIIYLIAKK